MKLDLKDKKILYELDRDARQSYAQIGRNVGVSKEVARYRIKKLEDKGVISRYFTEIDISRLGYFSYKLYVQFQNLRDEVHNELREYLFELTSNSWTAFCTGRWDLVFGFWAKDAHMLNQYMTDFINRFSRYILSKEVSVSLRFFVHSTDWLFGDDKVIDRRISQIGGRTIVELDDTAKQVLQELIIHPTMNITEISRNLGFDINTIKDRMQMLKDEHIIQSIKAYIDFDALGYQYHKVFIFANELTQSRLKKFHTFCRSIPNVIYTVECIGSWDLELELLVKDFPHFTKIMQDISKKFPELIRNYESVLIYDETGIKYQLL